MRTSRNGAEDVLSQLLIHVDSENTQSPNSCPVRKCVGCECARAIAMHEFINFSKRSDML